jgi:hypothetical protein
MRMCSVSTNEIPEDVNQNVYNVMFLIRLEEDD